MLNSALMTGGVAVIDELDLSIHPLVLPEIIRWFYDTERNLHNAQLWMTCQNASLLEELVKEEVFFCEKDLKGRTTVYGLQNIQAVRRGDNYYRKYLGGVYGAVPRLG
jgi:AAA15 family ATPase/GTPase